MQTLWNQLSHADRHTLWLWSGVFLLSIALYGWYRLIRFSLGHRTYKGVWFNREGYQALIERLLKYQQEAHRVLDADEIKALRPYLFGRKVKTLHKD